MGFVSSAEQQEAENKRGLCPIEWTLNNPSQLCTENLLLVSLLYTNPKTNLSSKKKKKKKCARHVRVFIQQLCLSFVSLHLHRDAALQLQLQLDHVYFPAGAQLRQLRCPCLHFIDSHVHWLELHLLLRHHLHAFLHVWKGVGSCQQEEHKTCVLTP